MNKSEILEHIHQLAVVEQVELVETVLHELGNRLCQPTSNGDSDREARRRALANAASEAVAYYRSDADVALWNC